MWVVDLPRREIHAHSVTLSHNGESSWTFMKIPDVKMTHFFWIILLQPVSLSKLLGHFFIIFHELFQLGKLLSIFYDNALTRYYVVLVYGGQNCSSEDIAFSIKIMEWTTLWKANHCLGIFKDDPWVAILLYFKTEWQFQHISVVGHRSPQSFNKYLSVQPCD